MKDGTICKTMYRELLTYKYGKRTFYVSNEGHIIIREKDRGPKYDDYLWWGSWCFDVIKEYIVNNERSINDTKDSNNV